MSAYQTEQEEFWAGDFGNDYVDRNRIEDLLPPRLNIFGKILSRTRDVKSVIEFGANIGTNLKAIHALQPAAQCHAVEINPKAAATLKTYDWLDNVTEGSFLDKRFEESADFSFTSGVLIHINPEFLPKAYEALYNASRKYVMVMEYYNPAPVAISYRGHDERLFKRDFAGEMMDRYPDLKLVDYGFVYHRDPNYPADDLNWFLMEKRS